ncbi:hypothetical protein GI582_22990 [Sulfitobacter sp. BDSS02]|nr:hypothetical protein [Sulfitobacter sp. BDSS02]
MPMTHEFTLCRNNHAQSQSIPGWIGVLELEGRRYLAQGWVHIRSKAKADLQIDLSRRAGSRRIVTPVTLLVHPNKKQPSEPDLAGSFKFAERHWILSAWMARDQKDKKIFKLKLSERDPEGQGEGSAAPVLFPQNRRAIRLPSRPR